MAAFSGRVGSDTRHLGSGSPAAAGELDRRSPTGGAAGLLVEDRTVAVGADDYVDVSRALVFPVGP